MLTPSEEQSLDQLTVFMESIPRGERYTMEKFQQLKALLEENKKSFIFEPDYDMSAFIINVYQHPPFPGADPIRLARISGDTIPKELQIERKIGSGLGLAGLHELSPFSHSEENARFLKEHRLHPAHDLSYYEY
ncbi:MAG: hypothetical protein ACAH17_03075 [Candidatus Paceibacterota bacterium]